MAICHPRPLYLHDNSAQFEEFDEDDDDYNNGEDVENILDVGNVENVESAYNNRGDVENILDVENVENVESATCCDDQTIQIDMQINIENSPQPEEDELVTHSPPPPNHSSPIKNYPIPPNLTWTNQNPDIVVYDLRQSANVDNTTSSNAIINNQVCSIDGVNNNNINNNNSHNNNINNCGLYESPQSPVDNCSAALYEFRADDYDLDDEEGSDLDDDDDDQGNNSFFDPDITDVKIESSDSNSGENGEFYDGSSALVFMVCSMENEETEEQCNNKTQQKYGTERTYTCPICRKKYVSKRCLCAHFRCHSGYKPFR